VQEDDGFARRSISILITYGNLKLKVAVGFRLGRQSSLGVVQRSTWLWRSSDRRETVNFPSGLKCLVSDRAAMVTAAQVLVYEFATSRGS